MENKQLDVNKKIAKQVLETYQSGDFTDLDKLIDTTKFKLHFPGNPEALKYDAAVKMNKEYNVAFPDAKMTVENQIAENNFVVTKVTYSGTHKGTLMGVSATGKKTKVSGMILQQIENGKVVEEWDEFDNLGMMQQIGAIPELETAGKAGK